MPVTNLSDGSVRRHSLLEKSSVAFAALAFAVAACANDRVHESEEHNFRVVTVVDGLQNPWGIQWLPNGDMLVTERAGTVRIVRDGRLLPEPVQGVPQVRAGGQGGLMDIALHPDFESNRLIYLSYSRANADDSEGTTAVVRGRFENNRLTSIEDVFVAQAWDNSRGHYGSRLAFDHDGYLFITVGDRQARTAGDPHAHPAQNLTNHYGTVIRLHDDGRIPDDNPFVGRSDALPEIWSYGHRNPQGLAVHPDTGDVWSNEHGPQGGDELNHVRPGLNYGWPVIGHGVNYGGAVIHEGTDRDDMEAPALHWTPSIAASGMMIYDGDQFPGWRGNVFSGGMSAQHQVLSRAVVSGQDVVHEELLLPGAYRIRDVRQGPDGYIYVAVDSRGPAGGGTPIVRLEPVD